MDVIIYAAIVIRCVGPPPPPPAVATPPTVAPGLTAAAPVCLAMNVMRNSGVLMIVRPYSAGTTSSALSRRTQRAPGLKNSISRGNIEKIKLSIRNENFNREWNFHSGPSLAAEKQGLGLKFSIENEIFKPRMKTSSENENFVRGGKVFSCVRARMNFFDPRALWEKYSNQEWPRQTKPKKGQNFSQGHSGTKHFNVNRACFLRKNTRIHRNGRTSWTFRFGPAYISKIFAIWLFLGGFWAFDIKEKREGGPKHPPKVILRMFLGGHRLDEQSGVSRCKVLKKAPSERAPSKLTRTLREVPPTPRVSQWKNFGSRRVEFEVLMCGGICVKFLAAIFPGNWRTKIREKISPKFRRIFASLFRLTGQKFHPNFALGNYRHNLTWSSLNPLEFQEKGSVKIRILLEFLLAM